MKNIMLAAATVIAIGFATTTASADHNNYRSYQSRGCNSYSTPYQAYRQSPSYLNRYHSYRAPYGSYPSSNYGSYRYNSYSRNSFGVNGQNFSFRIGF